MITAPAIPPTSAAATIANVWLGPIIELATSAPPMKP
jgi:hypothetical protein